VEEVVHFETARAVLPESGVLLPGATSATRRDNEGHGPDPTRKGNIIHGNYPGGGVNGHHCLVGRRGGDPQLEQ